MFFKKKKSKKNKNKITS